jgi:hypothetical protein
MRKLITLLSLLITLPLAWAEVDQAAIDKQLKDVERRESRERQKVDQAEEAERIKLHSRERDELARVQRENTAVAMQAVGTITATGGVAKVDTAALAQAKFAEDEVRNLIQNQAGAEISRRFDHDRRALDRKFNLERARIEAQRLDAGDDAAKQRDVAIKTAEINDRFQEKEDDLALEEAGEESKLRFTSTTKLNDAERALAEMVARHLFTQIQKPDATAYNPAADPEYTKLAAVRDQAKNALDTALEELHAKFNNRRTDLNNEKEDELAKLGG